MRCTKNKTVFYSKWIPLYGKQPRLCFRGIESEQVDIAPPDASRRAGRRFAMQIRSVHKFDSNLASLLTLSLVRNCKCGFVSNDLQLLFIVSNLTNLQSHKVGYSLYKCRKETQVDLISSFVVTSFLMRNREDSDFLLGYVVNCC